MNPEKSTTMKNTTTCVTELTQPISKVNIFFIEGNEVIPLNHPKADDNDHWKNFTMIGYSGYYKKFRNLKRLAVEFNDTSKMIEMNNLALVDIVALLKRQAIIYTNDMPNQSYLGSYFHYSAERVYSSTNMKSENFEKLFVTFRGLRLISDLINIDSSKEGLELLLDKNHANDCAPRSAHDDGSGW